MPNLKILKYDMPAEAGPVILTMPGEPLVLKFGEQRDYPRLWVAVDEGARPRDVEFLIVFTGQMIPASAAEYVGSCSVLGGRLVLHLFRKAVR